MAGTARVVSGRLCHPMKSGPLCGIFTRDGPGIRFHQKKFFSSGL